QGASVDWAGFDRPYRRRRVALPNYPFQRKQYWIEPVKKPDAIIGDVVSPLLGRRLPELAQAPQQYVWEVDFAARQLQFLQDHRVQGTAVMPLSGYLEAGLTAAAEILECAHCAVTELSLHSPL